MGVQTNQFCRAADIALSLRREGVPVMVGGFHVSGMLAMFPGVSREIQELLDAGVSVVAGEVEHRWHELLRDAWEGRLRPGIAGAAAVGSMNTGSFHFLIFPR